MFQRKALPDGKESICGTTQGTENVENTEMHAINLKELENTLYYRRDLQLICFSSNKDVAVFECPALVN